MTFGEAIMHLRSATHLRAARSGWNGKGMWIAYWHAGTFCDGCDLFDNCIALQDYCRSTNAKSLDIGGTLVMKAADGSIVLGWLAPQTDLLADDWSLV